MVSGKGSCVNLILLVKKWIRKRQKMEHQIRSFFMLFLFRRKIFSLEIVFSARQKQKQKVFFALA